MHQHYSAKFMKLNKKAFVMIIFYELAESDDVIIIIMTALSLCTKAVKMNLTKSKACHRSHKADAT